MPGAPNINVQKSVELFAKLKSSKRALPVALVHRSIEQRTGTREPRGRLATEAGFIGATLGAILILLVWGVIASRRQTPWV